MENLNLELTDEELNLGTEIEPELEDEMMDVVIGATVTDGEYKAVLKEIKPIITYYPVTETIIEAGIRKTRTIEKQGKVYNFTWTLNDGRTLIDPRFTRESEDPAVKFQSINIALGNIATQLSKPTLSMRELLELKPEITVWVSHKVGGKNNRNNRNVDYLKPLITNQAVNMKEDSAPF